MNKLNLVIYSLLALLFAFGLSFYFHNRSQDVAVSDPAIPDVLEEPVKMPVVRYPVPEVPSDTNDQQTTEQPGGDSAEPVISDTDKLPRELPTIENSDSLIVRALGHLLGGRPFDDFIIIDSFIQRLVLTINNLPEKKLPLAHVPFVLPEGTFVVSGKEGNRTIGVNNYARYKPYVFFLETVNPDVLIKTYVQLYPLLQTAYQDLGYPNAYFNDRLVYVIEHLLETPNPDDPLPLEQPSVLYTFADPGLEQRSAGQKILLRMGKDQRTRVMSILNNYHFRLTRLLP